MLKPLDTAVIPRKDPSGFTQDHCRTHRIKLIRKLVPGDMFIPILFKSSRILRYVDMVTAPEPGEDKSKPLKLTDPYMRPCSKYLWSIHTTDYIREIECMFPIMETGNLAPESSFGIIPPYDSAKLDPDLVNLADHGYHMRPWTVIASVPADHSRFRKGSEPEFNAALSRKGLRQDFKFFKDFMITLDPAGNVRKVFQFSIDDSYFIEYPGYPNPNLHAASGTEDDLTVNKYYLRLIKL